jgi:hypothetical protein
MSTTTQDARSRDDEKAKLRRILEAPSEKELAAAKLAEIEREEAEQREQQGRKAASDRCKAISRSVGSLVAQLEDDERKLNEAAQAYADAAAQVNARHGQIRALADENDALVDRFEGTKPAKIPAVIPPDRRQGVITAARIVDGVTYSVGKPTFAATEQCPYALRSRRNYAEVGGTVAYEIIAAAGLLPFPELNETQQRMVEERKHQGEQGERSLKEIATFAKQTVAEAAISGSVLR